MAGYLREAMFHFYPLTESQCVCVAIQHGYQDLHDHRQKKVVSEITEAGGTNNPLTSAKQSMWLFNLNTLKYKEGFMNY